MLNRMFRAALVATAATWVVKYMLSERRTHKAHAVKSERKAAVQDWENEGGAVMPPAIPGSGI